VERIDSETGECEVAMFRWPPEERHGFEQQRRSAEEAMSAGRDVQKRRCRHQRNTIAAYLLRVYNECVRSHDRASSLWSGWCHASPAWLFRAIRSIAFSQLERLMTTETQHGLPRALMGGAEGVVCVTGVLPVREKL
jgi:hypothetical protein